MDIHIRTTQNMKRVSNQKFQNQNVSHPFVVVVRKIHCSYAQNVYQQLQIDTSLKAAIILLKFVYRHID